MLIINCVCFFLRTQTKLHNPKTCLYSPKWWRTIWTLQGNFEEDVNIHLCRTITQTTASQSKHAQGHILPFAFQPHIQVSSAQKASFVHFSSFFYHPKIQHQGLSSTSALTTWKRSFLLSPIPPITRISSFGLILTATVFSKYISYLVVDKNHHLEGLRSHPRELQLKCCFFVAVFACDELMSSRDVKSKFDTDWNDRFRFKSSPRTHLSQSGTTAMRQHISWTTPQGAWSSTLLHRPSFPPLTACLWWRFLIFFFFY